MSNGEQPIIIKKVKKAGAHGHHGGAWKIAYADFVTAMMAFFLLMWLLNATSQEQKRGIASYFDPMSTGDRRGGGEGVMAGKTVTTEEMSGESTMSAVSISKSRQSKGDTDSEASESEKTEEQMEEDAAAESANFEETKQSIEKAVKESGELSEWLNNMMIDETPEGLRIQIIDHHEKSMFPSGSSQMYEHTHKLLYKVAAIINKLPNKISIAGHTDATPYNTKNYTNWELSSDRSNASRRVLGEAGIAQSRFSAVVGKEAREPFSKEDPFAPENRRISIVLLRQVPLKKDTTAAGKASNVKASETPPKKAQAKEVSGPAPSHKGSEKA